MDGWAHIGKLEGFVRQDSIDIEMSQCLSAVDDCLMKFQLISQMEIHSWQSDFATSAKLDHMEHMEALSEIIIGQEIAGSKLDKVMNMLQDMLAENRQTAQRTHIGISKNLWQLQIKSGELMPKLLKSGEVRRLNEQPIRWTSIIDVYEGIYLETEKVYIKALRVVDANEDSLRVRASNEK
ncbi:hypothetical protein DXG03_009643 [Asterophora parasitica]|uniref:Uncharacterized protein n=1 Tax=Asterophora parasitica TaxID=117018 RepID=A0A9P7G4L6_9AGAR|nr:hypothetical protein DXG03_009643 [Asterophora parasitica]